MSQVMTLLAEFETLSQAMLQAAEDQSWELLEQLSGARESVQAQLPAELDVALQPDEIEAATHLIQTCLALDKKTFALADERKKTVGTLFS